MSTDHDVESERLRRRLSLYAGCAAWGLVASGTVLIMVLLSGRALGDPPQYPVRPAAEPPQYPRPPVGHPPAWLPAPPIGYHYVPDPAAGCGWHMVPTGMATPPARTAPVTAPQATTPATTAFPQETPRPFAAGPTRATTARPAGGPSTGSPGLTATALTPMFAPGVGPLGVTNCPTGRG